MNLLVVGGGDRLRFGKVYVLDGDYIQILPACYRICLRDAYLRDWERAREMSFPYNIDM